MITELFHRGRDSIVREKPSHGNLYKPGAGFARCLPGFILMLSVMFLSACADQLRDQPSGSAKQIISFDFSPSAEGLIDEPARVIRAVVPPDAPVCSLTPMISHTGISIQPPSGVAMDFTSPVPYTVYAEDGSSRTYTVTASSAPIGLEVSRVTTSSISLAWNAVGWADGYYLEYKADGNSPWLRLNTDSSPSATAYTHAGLPSWARRAYRLAAYSSKGPGLWTSTVEGRTAPRPPSVPVFKSFPSVNPARIEWEEPLDWGDGDEKREYSAVLSSASVGFRSDFGPMVSPLLDIPSGLADAADYLLTVIAHNGSGRTAAATSGFAVSQPQVPAVPVFVSPPEGLLLPFPQGVIISWSIDSWGDGLGPAACAFTLMASSDPAFPSGCFKAVLSGSQLSYTYSVPPGTTFFRISADNGAAQSVSATRSIRCGAP